MLDYRLYYLRGGHIARADEFQAEGDDVALAVARDRQGDQHVELWNRGRMVAAMDSEANA